MSEESHENIHGDYGTLSATDYISLACSAVWILGMQCLSLITPCKFPTRLSNLSQVFELPRFLFGHLFFSSHPLQPSFPTSLKNFLIRTYVLLEFVLSILFKTPSRLVSDLPITEQTGSSPTVRSVSSSVQQPPASSLPAATAPQGRISTTASLAPNLQATG